MSENSFQTEPQATARESADASQASAGFPDDFQAEFETVQDSDGRFEVIRKFFHVRPVDSDEDIKPAALYYLRGKGQDFLLRVIEEAEDRDLVPIDLPLSGQCIKPMPKSRFVNLGKKRSLGLLLPKPQSQNQDTVDPDDLGDERESAGQDSDSADSPFDIPTQSILDNGAFNQLMDAARRSTLIRSVQPIANVRDREFRIGDYHKALHEIERLSRDFDAAAKQRDQKLRREELDIKSGRIKISPKEKMRRNQENTRVTQSVERARRAFSRVLNGLRTLEGGQLAADND
ncbi:MAG: hypothetical protein H8E44_44505 [Planctomycetes bacterium]|nr:hypothetical protein [Planctomycetota bacterium]